jgi:flavin reductase (DIM6/NTAB) family NADH-FMN oxidoreductase RutF
MPKVSRPVDMKMPKQLGKEEEWFGQRHFLPLSPVMVSCASKQGRHNIIPIISWQFACRWPPVIGIGICRVNYTPSYFVRASHKMILETGEFVINFPDVSMRDKIARTGELTANDPKVDKFAQAGLTPGKSLVVKAPIIEECPINLECVLTQHLPLGSHELFLGEVVAYHQDGELVSHQNLEGVDVLECELPDGTRKTLHWCGLMRYER